MNVPNMNGQCYPNIHECDRNYWPARPQYNPTSINRGAERGWGWQATVPSSGVYRQRQASAPSSGVYRQRQASAPSSGAYRQRPTSVNVARRPSDHGHVKGMLRHNPLLMMSFSYCPHCKKLAAKLDEEGISYQKWDIDDLPNKTQIIDEFEKLSGIRTAPQMFVNGRFVGDGSKTREMIDSGEFHALIGRRKQRPTSVNVARRPSDHGHVKGMLRHNPLLMMSFSYCPHCKKLAAKLDEEGISYRKWDIDNLPNKTQIIDKFEKLSGIRTAPQMFVNGRFVGDGSKTREMIDSGEFHALIGRRKEPGIINAPDLVYSVLERHPVVMMSFSYCPCCFHLVEELNDAGVPYYKFDVDKLPNSTEVINEFEKLSGIRTAPQMFISGEFIGDASTTVELIATGELQQLVCQLSGQ